jgi:hypothetical protein
MKISNSQPIWLPPDAPKRVEKALVEKSLMAPSSVASPAILFGKRKSASTNSQKAPQDPKLATEMERLTQRAPKLFGTPFVPKDLKPLLQKRALYNLKADPAILTECLPYRQLLVQKNDTASLKQYDALVEALMNNAEFYEVEKLRVAKQAVNNLYNLKSVATQGFEKNGLHALWKMWKYYFSGASNLQDRNAEFRNTMNLAQKIAKCYSDQILSKQLLGSGAKPLQDPSTRYLVASSISDLLFKSPEQARQILKNPKHPMRFILGKEQPLFTLGQFVPGFNLIFLNEAELWRQASKSIKESYTSQHEFVHALSDPVGGEVLPSMSQDQRGRFLKARTELQTLYSKKDAGLFGWIRRIWNGHSATGLRGYAFFNNFEFLTVTSDTFKSQPKELCRTNAGQEIYKIYKDIFKIDPANDFPSPKSDYKAVFEKVFGKKPYLNLSASE